MYLPVAEMASMQKVLTIAATLDLEVEQLNMVTAFLGSALEEEIYVKLPDGVLGRLWIVRLLKASTDSNSLCTAGMLQWIHLFFVSY